MTTSDAGCPPRGTDDAGLNPLRALLLVGFFAFLVVVPYLTGKVISEVLGTVLVFALLGLGLNIVVGYAGLLDLGYVFFFAVGAYATALLTGATLNTFTGSGPPAFSLDLNFYIVDPDRDARSRRAPGVLIGAPVLRLRGDYLALVTLGLGEIDHGPDREPVAGAGGGRAERDARRLGREHRSASGSAIRSTSTTSRWRSCSSRCSCRGVSPRPGSGGPGPRCGRTSRSPRRWA